MTRIIGVVVAAVALVLASPVIAVLCAVSACWFRANPLFTQPRLGLHGREFRFVKIRSLPVSTSTTADKHELAAVEVSRWGRFLRSTHLDELPQLWHVVTGRMNLVGPRPEMPTLAATFDQAFVQRRNEVRPGITGLWQVSEGVTGLIGDAPEYDLFYVRNRSAGLDAWILWRTLRSTVVRNGLITIDDVPRRFVVSHQPPATAEPVTRRTVTEQPVVEQPVIERGVAHGS